MAGLLLGPLVRYVDEDSATVWVETSRPCDAEVVCEDGSGAAGGVARTWQVAGHHYALVTVRGLRPGTSTPYRVRLDGQEVWPLPDSSHPPSTIRTLSAPAAPGADAVPGPGAVPGAPAAAAAPGDESEPALRVAFGSCRWAAPPSGRRPHRAGGTSAPDPVNPETHGKPYPAGRVTAPDPVGPDALDLLAARIAADPDAERPDVLLLLGDQVYADETSAAMRQWLSTRRDLSEPPGDQVADFEEYTRLYYESWLDPEVRWLLSTVPSCMIFDDHDVIDDWNTSESWREKIRATPWWEERVLSGLMSYWVYQHLGNLSPAELATDPLFKQVRTAQDGTTLVREFAASADADPSYTRWSYRRDFGRVRLLMLDTRAGRVLEEGRRAMLDEREWAWLREQVPADGPGAYDHLLIGTSLPWLLPPFIHDVERWNAALCAGERGTRWARFAEDLRQRADLEHWAAFPQSFDALGALVAEAGSGPNAPATVCVLSGDVHHAYVAEPKWADDEQPVARAFQLTCSPVHNRVPASIKLGFRFGWSRAGQWLGRKLARHTRQGPPMIQWRRTGGPWFGNQLMTLTLRGRGARLRLDQARRNRDGQERLAEVLDTDIGATAGGSTTG
ncbi:alkaline phosphatase D family protein [Streptomyces sp. NPDC004647]|uniref:alkaline phosphatase D family protein n=1 Tax=Streptomyces sp. NPDC004647 TaxID=3154671 RepID=UPI00339E89DE